MVANKTSRFAYDWWIIQKRFVYLVIAIFALCSLAAGSAFYVWKYGNPLRNVGEMKHPAGARFVSFEGDVRVIRAATREIVAASGGCPEGQVFLFVLVIHSFGRPGAAGIVRRNLYEAW